MSFFQSSDGLRLYFEDEGTGAPLLCLAGLTRNCRDFDPLAAQLEGVRLIRMDYRGRGKSDHDPNHLNYTPQREGQDALELLDHLGLGKTCVLGTSRGGLIAMVLAAMQTGRLSGVILNDVGPVIPPAGVARIMEYVGQKSAIGTLDQMARHLMTQMEPSFADVPLEVWREQAARQYVETSSGLELRYDARLRDALLAQAQSQGPAGPPDLWPLFEALAGMPLGCLRGANSDILDQETFAEMQRRIPAMVTAQVPGRGHVPFLDEAPSLRVIRTILKAS